MLIQIVTSTITKNHLWNFRDRLVLAVSGGMDSMCLLYILNTLAVSPPDSLVVVHVDHAARKTSHEDADFVRTVCRHLNLPFFLKKITHSVPKGLSPELYWRRERYRFLFEIKKRVRATAIATGHHADDQIETVLLKLIMGCGPKGLTGMDIKTEHNIIRPLLECDRESIERFMERRNLSFVQDMSNLDVSHPRNYIRHRLIPLIKEMNPSVQKQMTSLIHLLKDEDAFLTKQTRRFFRELNIPDKMPFSLSLLHIREIPTPLLRRFSIALIHRIDVLCQVRINRSMVDNLVSLLQGHLQHVIIHPIGSVRLLKHEAHFIPGNLPELPDSPVYLPVPGSVTFGPWSIRVQFEPFREKSSPLVMIPCVCRGPLYIRKRKPGDRWTLPNHTTNAKLKDIMNRLGIPSELRDQVPIIINENDEIQTILTHRVQPFYHSCTEIREDQLFIGLFSKRE